MYKQSKFALLAGSYNVFMDDHMCIYEQNRNWFWGKRLKKTVFRRGLRLYVCEDTFIKESARKSKGIGLF